MKIITFRHPQAEMFALAVALLILGAVSLSGQAAPPGRESGGVPPG